CESTVRSIRSVTVGTRTSAFWTASMSSLWLIGLSSTLSRASNSSRMRVSTTSGSLRVTITRGFLALLDMGDSVQCPSLATGAPVAQGGSARNCLTEGQLDDKELKHWVNWEVWRRIAPCPASRAQHLRAG